jgi:hypothetical protein
MRVYFLQSKSNEASTVTDNDFIYQTDDDRKSIQNMEVIPGERTELNTTLPGLALKNVQIYRAGS